MSIPAGVPAAGRAEGGGRIPYSLAQRIRGLFFLSTDWDLWGSARDESEQDG